MSSHCRSKIKFQTPVLPKTFSSRRHRKHDLSRVRAIGECTQHGLVWWKSTTIPSLGSLDPHLPFHLHFPAALFNLPHTPTALDTSSHAHALAIESLLGGPQQMSQLVGTSVMPSLVAGQMLRVREGWIGEVWTRTGRVQFASSFLASLFVGKWSAMVESEACATGMWVHRQAHWSDQILDIIGGSKREEDFEVGSSRHIWWMCCRRFEAHGRAIQIGSWEVLILRYNPVRYANIHIHSKGSGNISLPLSSLHCFQQMQFSTLDPLIH